MSFEPNDVRTPCYASRMNAPEALLLDLLEWLAVKPRRYDEVMVGWRTSCPRLPVWEDAVDLGLVERRAGENGEKLVQLTPAGEARLRARRPLSPLTRATSPQ